MRIAIAVLLMAILVPLNVKAEECVTAQSDILKLINDVSATTGRKFVVDPRVRAKVTLAGFKAESVDYEALKGILEVHAFTALEANDTVYVVPSVVAPEMKAKLGAK